MHLRKSFLFTTPHDHLIGRTPTPRTQEERVGKTKEKQLGEQWEEKQHGPGVYRVNVAAGLFSWTSHHNNLSCSVSREQAPLQVTCPGHVRSLALGLEVEITEENTPVCACAAQI